MGFRGLKIIVLAEDSTAYPVCKLICLELMVKFILILILVLAFILAPIIALKPRGRQNKLEQLRLAARTQGAVFSMRRLPPLKTDSELSAPLAVYSLPPGEKLQIQTEWILRRTSYHHPLNFFEDWDWANEQRPSEVIQNLLKSRLSSLPESVKGISAGPHGAAFYWTEEGEKELLQDMIDLLKQIKTFSGD